MKNISKHPFQYTVIIFVLSFSLSSCQIFSSNESMPQKSQEISVAQMSQIVDLKDGDTYELTAAPVKKIIDGVEQDLIAYNGMLPGPTLRVQQGSTIKVLFRNNTKVPNTIHSHGVRMDNASDGIPNVTQKPVAPGETFLYTLHFPDAGAYWYHPHMAEPENQESGLFGNFIVMPTEKNKWNDTVDREVPLFFHDILTDSDGQLLSFGGKDGQYTLMGRYGNKLMTNWDENYTLHVKQ